MTRITVDIPDVLLNKVKKRMAGSRVTLEKAVLLGLAELAAIPRSSDDDHLTALLADGLNSSLLDVDDEYWANKRANLHKKVVSRSKRKSA